MLLLAVLTGYTISAGMLYSASEKRCKKFEIVILDSNLKFLTVQNVVEMVDSAQLNPVGKIRDDINLGEIERLIKNNVYVDSVEVFTDVNANCVANIKQRVPGIRVATDDGYDFYLTENLTLLPPIENFHYNVPVINGNMRFDFDKNFYGKIEKKDGQVGLNLKKLLNFVKIVRNDEFLDDLIVQIWVDSVWKVDLVPRVGEQVICFGGLWDVQMKADKLSMFYQKCFKDGWWKSANVVNVEYKNQIIIQ